MRRTACFALIPLAALFYAQAAFACSPADKSLLARFAQSEQAFLATVVGLTNAAQPDSYNLKIEELFKAKSEALKVGAIIPARFNIRGQCGVGELKKGTRILVMANEGEILSSRRAMPIWLESEQAEAFLNPMFDELILLRRMLFPAHIAGATPDEDTAIHIATKTLIALVGPGEAKKMKPFKAERVREKSGEPRWIVQAASKTGWTVKIDAILGDVVSLQPK